MKTKVTQSLIKNLIAYKLPDKNEKFSSPSHDLITAKSVTAFGVICNLKFEYVIFSGYLTGSLK